MSTATAANPLLLNIQNEIRSARITLRPPRPGDGLVVYEAIIESIDSLRRFPASMPWVLQTPTVLATEASCREGQANFVSRKALPLLVLDNSSGVCIGSTGFHGIDWQVRKFEIGFWCRSSFQGKGFITEAVNALVALAFRDLRARRVQALTDELNGAANRVCERAGFALEGTLRNERVDPDGNPRNTRIYAITNLS